MKPGILVVTTLFGNWAMEIVDKTIDEWEPFEDTLLMRGAIPPHLAGEQDISLILNAALETYSEHVPQSLIQLNPSSSHASVRVMSDENGELHIALEVLYQPREHWVTT